MHEEASFSIHKKSSFHEFCQILNADLWQIVDNPCAPTWTAVNDICIKSHRCYLFSKCALTHF